MADPPGGNCLPPPPDRPTPEIVNNLAEADGVLLVIPGDPNIRPRDIGKRLRILMDDIAARRRSLYGRPVPIPRVAICLTMAELFLAPTLRGAGALGRLEGLDPQLVAEHALGAEGIAAVRNSVATGGEWYSLVSVFGFERRTGRAQAVSDGKGGWTVPSHFQPHGDDWLPYRLYEPLEFLARGVCWRDGILS
ncbi:hypothetical protein [Rhodospirillum sp. A1_3_36]|uniref:hypothetical protein n=1 Tax=Rhodospirillum sp. A1_3_36 TaxID=3391666 RepID=UPI0039A701CA